MSQISDIVRKNLDRQRRLARPMVRARIARALRILGVLPGWQRFVNWLVPDHCASFTICNGKTNFAGDIGSYVDRQVYLFGDYESREIEIFLSQVSSVKRGSILDIGANVGTHSSTFARAFETVLAFEPNPKLWAQFENNMALNSIENVQLHKLGLADVDSERTLYLIDKPNYGLGTFSPVEQYDLPLSPIAICPIRHAGNYLTEIGVGRIDAVKIDVQGYEPEVLRGLRSVLERDRPVVWCEIGAGTLAKLTTTDELSTMVPFKFNCYQITSKARWIHSSIELRKRVGHLPCGNYILVPAEQGADLQTMQLDAGALHPIDPGADRAFYQPGVP